MSPYTRFREKLGNLKNFTILQNSRFLVNFLQNCENIKFLYTPKEQGRGATAKWEIFYCADMILPWQKCRQWEEWLPAPTTWQCVWAEAWWWCSSRTSCRSTTRSWWSGSAPRSVSPACHTPGHPTTGMSLSNLTRNDEIWNMCSLGFMPPSLLLSRLA